MAEKFYKRPSNQRGLVTPNINSPLQELGVPNTSIDYVSKARRTIEAIDNIGRLASTVVTMESDRQNKEARDQARSDVAAGMEDPSVDSYKVNIAFNRFKADALASKAPSFIEDMIKAKGSLADMDDNKIVENYNEARNAYVDQYKDKGYADILGRSLDARAESIQNYLIGQRDSIKREQAKEMIQNKARETFMNFKGNPDAFSEAIDGYKEDAKLSMAQGNFKAPTDHELGQYVMEALMTDAINGNGDVYNYLTSRKARDKFGKVPGFGENLNQVRKQWKRIAASRASEELSRQKDRLYDTLLLGGWGSQADMEKDVMSTGLSSQEKYRFIKQFGNKMQAEKQSDDLLKYIYPREGTVNPYPYVTAPQSTQKELYKTLTGIDTDKVNIDFLGTDNTSDIEELKSTNPDLYNLVSPEAQLDKMVSFVDAGIMPPSDLRKSINSPIDSGNWSRYSDRLDLYIKIKERSDVAASTLFDTQTISKLEMFNRIRQDSDFQTDKGLDSAKMRDYMDSFSRAIDRDASGEISMATFKSELSKRSFKGAPSIEENFYRFAEDLNNSVFSRDKATAPLAADFGKKILKNVYVEKRAVGYTDEEAKDEAERYLESNYGAIEIGENFLGFGGHKTLLSNTWSKDPDILKKFERAMLSKDFQDALTSSIGTPAIDPSRIEVMPSINHELDDKIRIFYDNSPTGLTYSKKEIDSFVGSDLTLEAVKRAEQGRSEAFGKGKAVNYAHRKRLQELQDSYSKLFD